METWKRRHIVLPILLTLFFMIACNKQPESTISEQETNVSERESKDFVQEREDLVSEYGKNMTTAYTQGKQAGTTGNLSAVKKTIEAYHASHDRYPESLEEIRHMFGSPIDLSIYDYDPDTGQVSLKK